MLLILLCAYNEEPDIAGLLASFREQHWPWQYRLIVVDDGSTDATADILTDAARRMPITVITHPVNKGLGAALASGFKEILAALEATDIVITMDADRTHPVTLIPAMVGQIESGYDIVIASRYAPGGAQVGLPLYRRMLSRAAAMLLCVVWPMRGVRDYTSGFRAFSGKIVKEAYARYGDDLVKESGFPATFELLLKMGMLTGRIDEVPLQLHYENKAGASKMKVIRTIRHYFRMIARQLMKDNQPLLRGKGKQ